jgi:peptidoglycan/LPS O-acetylase OafA/YrhL
MRRERELTHHMAAPTPGSSPQPAVKPSRPAGYLPTLDGWRTIAILSVMFCHDSVHHLGPFSTAWLHEHGNLGVDVFFAISGILICSRLLTEEDSQGFISRRSFYIRRAFRILPPATVFLATLLALKATVHLPVQLPEVLASLFFVRNYTFTFSHFQTIYPFYTSHFWSLAVEEHFYFLLPSLLVFTPKKWRAPLLLILASAISLHRIAPSSWLSFHSDMRLDALLVPAAFAVLLRSPLLTQPTHRQRLTQALRLWPIIVIALLIPITYDLIPRTTGVLIAWLMPLIILGTMLHPQSLFSRLLENPILRYIGRISYSLYLWQQLFLISHFGANTARLGILQSSPLNWLLTFACAIFSYYLIERPLIRLGHHLAPNVAANQVERGSP